MKHLFHVLACLLFFVGCQSQEDKANKLIDEYMFKHLHDYKSYEVVETTIDTLYNSPFSDSECINLAMKANKHLEETIDYGDDAESDERSMDIWSGGWSSTSRNEYKKAYKSWLTNKKGEMQARIDFLNVAKGILEKAETLSGKEQIGWIVTHKFRSNTLGGNTSLGTYLFFMDKDFKKILATYDDDDDDTSEAISTMTTILTSYDSVASVDTLITGWNEALDSIQKSMDKLN